MPLIFIIGHRQVSFYGRQHSGVVTGFDVRSMKVLSPTPMGGLQEVPGKGIKIQVYFGGKKSCIVFLVGLFFKEPNLSKPHFLHLSNKLPLRHLRMK